MGHCWVVGGVDAPAGVEEDPPVLAPQHRGGTGGGAWVDEVSEVKRGGDVAVLDELDAVAARRNASAGLARGRGFARRRREKMAAWLYVQAGAMISQ